MTWKAPALRSAGAITCQRSKPFPDRACFCTTHLSRRVVGRALGLVPCKPQDAENPEPQDRGPGQLFSEVSGDEPPRLASPRREEGRSWSELEAVG